MAELENIFCVMAESVDTSCPDLDVFIYEDSTELIPKLYAIFQNYIPKIAAKYHDCEGKPIKILKEDITLTPPSTLPPMGILLTPTDDLAEYGEGFDYEDSSYKFEVFLHVRGRDFEGNVWNLIKLENIVKTLVIALEKILQTGHIVTFEGFRFLGTEQDTNYHVRTGLLRFGLTRRSSPQTIRL